MNRKEKGWEWTISPGIGGNYSYESAQLAVLMDIRDEMEKMNRLLHCHNAVDIPNILRRIDKNTKRPAPKRKVKK